MLTLTVTIVPEQWDPKTKRFVPPKEKTLQLEHSLVSLSKWESKWHKPFLSKEAKTNEETIDYIKCMTITQNVDQDVYNHLSQQNINDVTDYIEDTMTATTFPDDSSRKKNHETVTAELIYYWMVAYNIPFDPCQKWHLNRLITLIRVCGVKNSPPKKMSKGEIMARNAKLNAERRAKLNSKG